MPDLDIASPYWDRYDKGEAMKSQDGPKTCRHGNPLSLFCAYCALDAPAVSRPDRQDGDGLRTPYVPTLLRLNDPSRLEYISKDCTAIYNPVDQNFFYITDMETRKIVGFQFLLPREPKSIAPPNNSQSFPLSEIAPGFTLADCGCREDRCEGRTDGTCHSSTPQPTRDAVEGATLRHHTNETLEEQEYLLSKSATPKPAPDAVREALENARPYVARQADYESGLDHDADTVCAANALKQINAALSAPPDGATAQDCWHELVEKTDRTSPEEYPEMALITFEELRDFIERAAPSATGAAGPVATWRYRNDLGEVTSEWIDGPVPEYVRDATTGERIATSGMNIDRAYATPPVRGDRETIARAICEADGYDYDNERRFANMPADGVGQQSARQIIDRAHRYADAILRVQPGAGEREEIAGNVQSILANELSVDGDREIVGAGPASFKIADYMLRNGGRQ